MADLRMERLLLDKKLIFITGKGGTGKSTISLYLARKLALMGRKTLLVEVGERSSIEHLAHLTTTVAYQPQPTALGFDGSLIRGVDCLVDYVSSYVKVESLTKYFFDNPLMRTLLDIAPGLDDLAILGKLTSHIRHHGPGFNYDHIIIDSHSTGSFMSMLSAPKLLSKMVSSGPLHSQSLKISDTLKDPNVAHVIFVSLFEKSPIEELLESTKDFSQEFNMPYSVLVNKVLPDFKPSSQNQEWEKFIALKLEQQRELKNIVLENYTEIYSQKLVTEDIRQNLLQLERKSELFHLMN